MASIIRLMFHQKTRLYLHQIRPKLHKQNKGNKNKTPYRGKVHSGVILKELKNEKTRFKRILLIGDFKVEVEQHN